MIERDVMTYVYIIYIYIYIYICANLLGMGESVFKISTTIRSVGGHLVFLLLN